MKNQITKSVIVVLFIITTFFAKSTYGTPIFADDFEADLSLWTGKSGGINHGIIVEDPLRAGNHALTFTALNSAGDIYSSQQFSLVPGQIYRVSFEYLGLAISGSVPGNLGGFAGMSEGLSGRHMWYYGTSNASFAAPVLIDDGQWRTYTFDFVPPIGFPFGGGSGSAVHLMFEDFSGSGGVVGDAFFDNVNLALVPEPISMLLFGTGLVGIAGYVRRKFKG